MPFITVNNSRTSNYLNQVYRNNDCIFFYYWNNCGHCHQFRPIFDEVIRDLMNTREEFMKKAYIFQIELSNFELLPDEFKEVQAFPSVITYSNGRKTNEFKDQRTKTNLNDFILSSLGEPSKTYVSSSSSSSKKKVIKKYTYPKTKTV